jgi:hypothetical protein
MAPDPQDRQGNPLWQQLCAFVFDDPAMEPPFTVRLAEGQGWSEEFASRAVEEYRRFLYLAATRPGPLVPSEAVDKVWHLHLLDTRSYWDALCRHLIGRPLHHNPSSGGEADREAVRVKYRATLAAYREVFADPPEDVWPAADEPVPRAPHPARYRPRECLCDD